MARLLKLLVLVPLALIAVGFAFANRQGTTVSFDPFATDVPAFALSAPLFVVLLIVVATGVVLGGVATWFGQGSYRREARVARRQNDDLRSDIARLKADLAAATATVPLVETPAAGLPALPDQRAA